jgi:lipopolysaccharide/colanic/teichoic acid biosynthesis glycosyltransferase
MIRRMLDILGAVLALTVFGVPMAMIAVAVRMETPGGAIFRQRRAGRGGRPFEMLKFRTMRADVDAYAGSPRSGDDPRLTRVGRFLREASLDELPQLINVLRGEMSLVGPRPLYERQAARWDHRQRRRLDARPGVTGYAQAYGRAGLTIEDKIEMDLHYLDRRSLWLDLRILARTVANVFTARRQGIYEQRYSRDKDRELD